MEYPSGLTRLPETIRELYAKCVRENIDVAIIGNPQRTVLMPRGPLPQKLIVIGYAPNAMSPPGTVAYTPVVSTGFQALINAANEARRKHPKMSFTSTISLTERDLKRLRNCKLISRTMNEFEIKRAAYKIKVSAKKIKYYIKSWLTVDA